MSLFGRGIFCVLSSLFFLFGLVGCGGEERFKETISLQNFQQQTSKSESQQNSGEMQRAVMPSTPDAGEGDYLLGPGDLLSIKVLETDDLDAEIRVSSKGIINVPLLGDVNVMNMTASEAEQLIEHMYRKDYFHDPHVAVYIKEHVSKQITLVGAINHPGTYEYVSRRRLLDVLAIGSGLTEKAGSFAFITRKDHKTGETSNYMIDLDDLIRNGNMAQNHVILGGDVIYLPESGQCFVDGAVRKPGTYELNSNMTIAEAIALAGGLASYADDDKIKLIRFMGRGRQREVVSLSYDDIQKGLGDTLLLKDQDIVFAESSASGKMFSGAGFTLGFMGTGVSFKDPDQR
jgi:polysaccharide export outer membrane protein